MAELLFIATTTFIAFVIFAVLQGDDISKKRKAMETYLLEIPDFSATQKVLGTDGTNGLAIDEQRKKICLIDHQQQNISCRVVEYESLLSSELFEDDSTVTKTVRSSQIGGALIGGVALGGVGAIIGGLSGQTNTSEKVKRIDLRLTVNDTRNPLHDVNFLNFEMKKDSPNYQNAMKTARHWHSLIEVLIKRSDMEDRENPASISQTQPISIADELKKLADLRDSGILNVEEFQQQKAKLLGSLAI